PRCSARTRARSRTRSCSSASRRSSASTWRASAARRRSPTSAPAPTDAARTARASSNDDGPPDHPGGPWSFPRRLLRVGLLLGHVLALDLVMDLALGFLELPQRLTEPARHLGNLARSEDQQNREQHEPEFRTAESEHRSSSLP